MPATKIDARIADECATYYADPVGFALWAFDWGHGELKGFDGLDVWQRETLEAIGDHVTKQGFDGVEAVAPLQMATSSGHGIGKAHPLSMMLDTPDGRRKWGDIAAGDRLFGKDGSPVTVVARHDQGVRKIYRVSFSDGSSVLADADHLWSVKGRKHRRRGLGWAEMTTQEIIDAGVKRPNGNAQARQWEIPSYQPVEYPPAELPVDPYLYGLWLGDGSKRCSAITSADPEVFETISQMGYELGTNRHTGGGPARTHVPLGLLPVMKREGLHGCTSENCRVDSRYRYASVTQRVAVLQGLLDSDGWVEQSGTVAFGSISADLTTDVVWLARSLGMIARLNPVKEKWYRNRNGEKVAGRPFHTCTITWDGVTQLFRLARHQSSLRNPQTRYKTRWVDSIEYSHDEEAMCVTVDAADQLYLADNFVVTHNSCLTAIIILWIMSTRPFAKGVVTANTSDQLRTKTWGELGKWKKRCITGHWFEYNNGKGNMNLYHADHAESWRVDAQTCREENSEAFAGLHAANSTPFFIFDEASAIPEKIWEVAKGGLTDGEPMFLCFGNPTRNSGSFFECFNRMKHRWITRKIDSRQAAMTNKTLLAEWVTDYGEDSDFVRVRVRGEFPRASSCQFIGSDLVAACQDMQVELPHGAKTIAVDVARFGDDQTVISLKEGRKVYEMQCYRGIDTMKTAALVMEQIKEFEPDATFIDGGGVGGGVIDRLRQLGADVIEINFGSAAGDDEQYANKRAEMYGNLKEAMAAGIDIPNDTDLVSELTSVEYGFDVRQRILLEKKESMKKRGLASPDRADALALHYAESVMPKNGGMPKVMRSQRQYGSGGRHAARRHR